LKSVALASHSEGFMVQDGTSEKLFRQILNAKMKTYVANLKLTEWPGKRVAY
jgi:hypothetical protein